MKDKIISFIMISIIILLIGIIGIIGFAIYKEILEIDEVQMSIFEESGDSTLEKTKDQNTADLLTNAEIYNGVDAQTPKSENKHLYKQLNSTAKTIYDELYKNRENLKTGTYTVQFGEAFQSLLSKDNGESELKKEFQSAIEVLIYENPEIFYLDATNMFLNIEKTTRVTGVKYNVYINNGNKPNYLTDGLNSKKDVEEYVEQIEQAKNHIISMLEGKSNYEKIKIVHDYLIDNIEYDSTLSENNIYDVYGALILKKCVCEGYAKAFQYIMNEVGIENTIVIGTSTNSKNKTENHSWNYVKLNEKWYAIDVTWDDPVITGGGKLTKKLKYEYFLKGSEQMNKNHKVSNKFTEDGQEFSYPELSEKDYK